MMTEGASFPSFGGGAGGVDDETMTQASEREEPLEPGDYVLQNFQCRLGNPRNRCYANSPFRLWAGSVLSGPQMWNKTASAVMAALSDNETVQITSLSTLQTLWNRFDDRIQDDAARFLSEMVELASPGQVIANHFHVDHRQQVHRRKEFPTHLIFEDQAEEQELKTRISR